MLLLDRYEQPERRQTVRVRLHDRIAADYFSADDGGARRVVNAELQTLAQAGVLRLTWRRWEEGNWLEAVDLIPSQAGELYRLLQREPRLEQQSALEQLLVAQAPAAPWHESFLHWARSQLETNRAPLPLVLDDPTFNRDLLLALDGLAGLSSPTLERVLSVQLFSDSKRLEALRRAILAILRRHDPASALYGDDDWALLDAHGLLRAPEYVPLAGPIRLRLEDATVDLSPFLPSVALSAAMLSQAAIEKSSAALMVTVENMTSFNELLRLRPPDVIAVYTGGFASPRLMSFLRALRNASAGLALAHWGDMDAGGLRILAHLRGQLGVVDVLAMDSETFSRYQRYGQPLSPGDREALSALAQHPYLADQRDLIDALLGAGVKVEQEAVAVDLVRKLIDQWRS